MDKKLYNMNGDWLFEWMIKFNDEKTANLRRNLEEHRHTISATSESYRVINHWGKMGLLLKQDSRGNGWRKFSYVDLMWIYVISDLRKFGLSLDAIKKVKESIFCRESKGKEDIYYFELFLPLIFNDDVIMVVLPDGQAELCVESDYHNSQRITPIPTSHIVISLNQILGRIQNKPELAQKKKTFIEPTKNEIGIRYSLMKEEDLKEIRIAVDKGEMKKVNYIKRTQSPKDVMKYISQALKEGGRKDLLIKQDNGKVVLLERTDKE